jgi:hypothetical protein
MQLQYLIFFPLMLAGLLTGCAKPVSSGLPVGLPPTIDGGRGSENGNYLSMPAGEIIGPEGTPCRVFVWDRPLSDGRVLRQRSASCAFAARPGGLIAIELDRQIVPISESDLRFERP